MSFRASALCYLVALSSLSSPLLGTYEDVEEVRKQRQEEEDTAKGKRRTKAYQLQLIEEQRLKKILKETKATRNPADRESLDYLQQQNAHFQRERADTKWRNLQDEAEWQRRQDETTIRQKKAETELNKNAPAQMKTQAQQNSELQPTANDPQGGLMKKI